MKKTLIYIVSLLILSSCHYFAPVNETVYKKPSNVPTISQIAGRWAADSNSYNLIKKKGYKPDSISLIINNDSTFTAVNFPDLVANISGSPVKKELHNGSGIWRVYTPDKEPILYLTFKAGELFKTPSSIPLSPFTKDSKLVLLLWIGDPDNGEQIVFVKK